MAKKSLENLAKELGYKDFNSMKESVGGSYTGGFLSSLFKKKKAKPTAPTKDVPTSEEPTEARETSVFEKALPFLDIIAKNSISLPGMARDVNVLRQNIAKLVKIKGESAATKADKFFKTEEQREAEMESARAKSKIPTVETKGGKEPAPKESGGMFGGLLDMLNPVKLIGGLITGIVGAFGAFFSGGSILALLAKLFVPAMIIGGLINGILDGIKIWKEGGSIVDTLVSALGGFLKFITFGLFGEKELREGMDSAIKFILPFIIDMTEVFDKFVTWIKNNVGFPGYTIPLSKANDLIPEFLQKKGVKLEDFKIPAYYPFKKDTGSTKAESYTSSATTSLKQTQAKLDSGEGVFYDGDARKRLEEKPKEEKQKASQDKLGEAVKSTSPTPDPYSPVNAEKSRDAAKGFLSTKAGVTVDPSSSTGYTDQASGKPITEEEVRRKIIAVGGEPTKILQIAKGEKGATAVAGSGYTSGGVSAAPAAGGEITASPSTPAVGGAAPSSPMPTPAMTAPSGSSLSSASSEVAEGQRMDAAADAGTTFNAPIVNNTTGQKAPSTQGVADVYNTSFIRNYLTA
jgi:hypothetical protein